MKNQNKRNPQIFYGTLDLFYEQGLEACQWSLEEDPQLMHARRYAEELVNPDLKLNKYGADRLGGPAQSLILYHAIRNVMPGNSDSYYDTLVDKAIKKDAIEKVISPYDGLHPIEKGDTLLVGVTKKDFLAMTSADIVRIDDYYKTPFFKRSLRDHAKILTSKSWKSAIPDIQYDYAKNKVELTVIHGASISDLGSVQRLHGNTVNGLPKNVKVEKWYDLFKNETPAILIKADTPKVA